MVQQQWALHYQDFFDSRQTTSFRDKVTCIIDDISYEWSTIYCKNNPAPCSICRFTYNDFVFIFDDTDDLVFKGTVNKEDVPPGRVVAVYGTAIMNAPKRNKSRISGYLGQTGKIFSDFGNDYDKGHFIANAAGGPLEINLFPQKRSINQGRCDSGKKYRQMEKFVAHHPGTFVFSRPFYNDFSLRPFAFEFGYIAQNGTFEVDTFNNM